MLYDDWHTCLDDTPSHMQSILPSKGSWQAHQIFCSNARPAHISNGWLIWRGFLQVLLEIMSGVVIFECCLQGLLASPFTAQRQRMHQSEGDTTLSCTSSPLCHFKVKICPFTRSVRLIDKLPAWRADIQLVSHCFSLTFRHSWLIVLTGLLEVWSLVLSLDNAMYFQSKPTV